MPPSQDKDVLNFDFLFGDDDQVELPAENTNSNGNGNSHPQGPPQAPQSFVEEEVRAVTIFDVETGALPDEHLDRIRPPFDRESVKDGRLKPEKLLAKRDAAEASYASDFKAKAALSPLTGQVLAIGFRFQDKERRDITSTAIWTPMKDTGEAGLLDSFWDEFSSTKDEGGIMAGFCCHEFDIPFLVRRSWILGVPIPPAAFDPRGFFSPVFVDLYRVWKCGCRFNDPPHVDSKLGTLARCFGLDGKLDGLDGSDFARLWNGTPQEREKARQYLLRDVEITWQLARRMGVAR